MKKICEICNKTFVTWGKRVLKARFCSRKCKAISQLGKPAWNKGLKYNEETRKKISEAMNLQYENGIRDRFKITQAAHEALKERTRQREINSCQNSKLDAHGYKLIYTIGGWMKEHHYVWKKAGKEIPQGMHLHHKNGNRIDNRLENLELMSAPDHHKLHYPEISKDQKTGRFLKGD